MSSKKQKEEDIGELAVCPICMEYFVDPRILPCSHTYCHRCIHKMAASNRGEFECPLRDDTRIQKNLIDSLPLNRTVQNIVGLLLNPSGTSGQSRGTSKFVSCRILLQIS